MFSFDPQSFSKLQLWHMKQFQFHLSEGVTLYLWNISWDNLFNTLNVGNVWWILVNTNLEYLGQYWNMFTWHSIYTSFYSLWGSLHVTTEFYMLVPPKSILRSYTSHRNLHHNIDVSILNMWYP
jgi:hypothetical protein